MKSPQDFPSCPASGSLYHKGKVDMESVRIVVNGQCMDIVRGTSVSLLLSNLKDAPSPDMLVEINQQFIHQEVYDSTWIEEGDVIEIIHMAMGG